MNSATVSCELELDGSAWRDLLDALSIPRGRQVFELRIPDRCTMLVHVDSATVAVGNAFDLVSSPRCTFGRCP